MQVVYIGCGTPPQIAYTPCAMWFGLSKQMYFTQQPTILETSGVSSGFRESEDNVTTIEHVTTNTNPTVNSSPQERSESGGASKEASRETNESSSSGTTVSRTEHKADKTLDSYRTMASLANDEREGEEAESENEENSEDSNPPVVMVTRSGRAF